MEQLSEPPVRRRATALGRGLYGGRYPVCSWPPYSCPSHRIMCLQYFVSSKQCLTELGYMSTAEYTYR